MSLSFSSTTDKRGIIQTIERTLKLGDATISGNATKLAEWTADINLAKDRMLAIILKAGGKWQFDDTNQTDYPIITTNLVSGQRDYTFTVDGSSNLILDIYRVAILPSTTATLYQDINPVDQQSDVSPGGLVENNTATGTPAEYDKTGNGIFLDPIPSYNATNGLKVWINRETTYYTVSDTTKKSGFAGIFDEYLVLRPVYEHACRNSLKNEISLRDKVFLMEQAIADYYGQREKDERPVLQGEIINFI